VVGTNGLRYTGPWKKECDSALPVLDGSPIHSPSRTDDFMMQSRLHQFFACSLLLGTILNSMAHSEDQSAVKKSIHPPKAMERPHVLEAHGQCRIDEFYWMREREDPEVIQWLEAENAYRQSVMSSTEKLQSQLVDELRQRIKQDDESAAYPDRGFLWYTRTKDGQQYESHFRKKIQPSGQSDATEELVLDENQLAEGHEFCSVGQLQVSPDGRIVAWPVDVVGRRVYTIQFRDMATGEMLADEIGGTTGNMIFAEDNLHLFYTRQDPETLRSDRVFRHRIGSDPNDDRLVYFEADEQFSVYLLPTKSRQYIQLVSSQTLSNEYRLLDSFHPENEAVVFLPREADHEYHLDHLGERFVIRTNWDAPNFRLMESAAAGGPKADWVEIVPHDSKVFLEEFELLRDWLVIEDRSDGLTRIRYRKYGTNDFEVMDFGEPCYSAGLAPTVLWETDTIRYAFSSLKTPPSVIDADLSSGQKTVVKQEEVLGGFQSENYVTERLWATAGDGVRVPIGLIRHRETPVDGSAPLLVYGYGSYGYSMEDGFSPLIFNLVDRGFVYAIAHIRGGQELGRQWYEDGKLLKKRNTFTDFIDCTRHLIASGFADPKRVYARGGSAGGLLMGAVMNLAPELYHGIIADVPFVDVVTTMLDDSIPLTTSEYDEWGNPNERQYYDVMLSYSPYDNIRNVDYPNLLVTTGLHDSQVQYWEPAKWVARLRQRKTDDNLLLLHTEMHAGHGGSSGRYDRYKEIAMRQAFLLMLAGIEN
jgi:oligopeptidase B